MHLGFSVRKTFYRRNRKRNNRSSFKGIYFGLTVLGGEPFEPENQEVLAPFLSKVKKCFPRKQSGATQATFTTRTFFLPTEKKHCAFTEQFLSCIDVLVDGSFIEELKDISLQFRGSRNQRILHLK